MFSKVKKMKKMRSIQCDICEDVWTYPWMSAKLAIESIYSDGWRESSSYEVLCPDCVENECRELDGATGALYISNFNERSIIKHR